MRLKVLGSSSKGNCYFLENEKECLIIEAGIKISEVKKELDFDIGKVVGVIVSHSHGDHAAYVNKFPIMGIPIFKPYEVMAPSIRLGNFIIRPFSLEHDVPCYGFHISHKDIGNLVFITDTYFVKYKFENIDHLLIECNYVEEILHAGRNQALINRTLKSHMGLETVVEFLKANNSDKLKNVVLLHLSDRNSNEELILKKCYEATNKKTYIADKGLIVELGKE